MFKFKLAEFSVQWDNMGVRVLKGLENVSSLYSAQKFKLKNSLLFCVESNNVKFVNLSPILGDPVSPDEVVVKNI